MTKGKQNTLWDEEKKKGLKTPGPLSYAVNALPTQLNRFEGRHAMGYDVKCTSKKIIVTPGPE